MPSTRRVASRRTVAAAETLGNQRASEDGGAIVGGEDPLVNSAARAPHLGEMRSSCRLHDPEQVVEAPGAEGCHQALSYVWRRAALPAEEL